MLARRLREVRVDRFGEEGVDVLAGLLGIPPRTWLNYEAGIKTEFWNRKAVFNLSIFRTDIKNFQALVNAGRALSAGGLLESIFAEAEAFGAGRATWEDDATVVVVKRLAVG